MDKVDNDNLGSKVALRRYMLNRYHQHGAIDVLDCCQGSGVLWAILRAEFKIRRYYGLDTKHKPGRLRVDSARVLIQGTDYNVVDIDTYGSPWKHYLALCSAGIDQAVTVFMTCAQLMMNVDAVSFQSMGFGNLKPPRGVVRKMQNMTMRYSLCRCYEYGIRLVHAVEAPRGRTARYIGVRIEPETSP